MRYKRIVVMGLTVTLNVAAVLFQSTDTSAQGKTVISPAAPLLSREGPGQVVVTGKAAIPGAPAPGPAPAPLPALGAPYSPPLSGAGQIPLPGTNLVVIDICHSAFAAPGTAADWAGTPQVVIVPPGVVGRVQLHFRLCLNNVPPFSPTDWNIQVYFGAAPSAMGTGFTFNLNPLTPFFTTVNLAGAIGTVPPGAFLFNLVLTVGGIVTDFLDPVLITGTALPGAVSTSQLGDHYKCYRVKGKVETKGFMLADQFGFGMYQVIRPTKLCNPVDKDREGTINKLSHLVCYEIKRKPREAFNQWRAIIENQFGSQSLKVIEEEELCVPSLKFPIAPPGRPTRPPRH